MRSDREIILWIAVGFFLVSSVRSVLGGEKNGVCGRNVSFTVTRRISYQKNVTRPRWFSLWPKTTLETVYNITNETKWKIIDEACCDGYGNKTGTCELQCSKMCANGYCQQPNICTCDYGWGGDLCDEPLLCFVRVNFTEATSETSELKSVQDTSENPHIELMSPECHSKCDSQLNSTAYNVTGSGNDIYYFIPIDSPCNTLATRPFSITFSNWIGAVAGIVIFIVVAYTVHVARRKRKVWEKNSDQPTQYVLEEYIEENPIYS